MLAFALIPGAARVARADGPIIDADVLRLMNEKPDEEHPLIIVVELSRQPIDLETLLPTTDVINECTARWRALEELQERRKQGEDIPNAEMEATEREARELDEFVRQTQDVAHDLVAADYAAIAAESIPQALEDLRTVFGDRVRWGSRTTQLLTVRARLFELEAICKVRGVRRVAYDIAFQPLLDVSRQSIEADRVHNGEVGGIPYTGAGVKVALVDTALRGNHPRLPVSTPANRKNFACRDGRDALDPCDGNAGFGVGHGTATAGIIFTQPSTDAYLGIGHGSTLVFGKVFMSPFTACGSCTTCPPGNSFPFYWSTVFDAFSWAATGPQSVGPDAAIISSSVGGFDTSHENTDANSIPSLNSDWVVSVGGASIAQACGNEGSGGILSPSGAPNCISVGNYDDGGTPTRSDDAMHSSSSWGQTYDGRRKPEVSGPGIDITSTKKCFTSEFDHFVGGWSVTSFAAPHVAGTMALMKEARPSLTPRQMHAIVINTAEYLSGQGDWDVQAGWGQLNAYQATLQRNQIIDGTLTGSQERAYALARPAPGTPVRVTCVWHRQMASETEAVSGSPGNLNLFLDRKEVGGLNWELDRSKSESDVDNVEQVRDQQPSSGQQYDFRVRVKRIDSTVLPTESFTLASRQVILGP